MTERRARTPQPTESGWYYVRRRVNPIFDKLPITIVRVELAYSHTFIANAPGAIHEYTFFGPVPMIEAEE